MRDTKRNAACWTRRRTSLRQNHGALDRALDRTLDAGDAERSTPDAGMVDRLDPGRLDAGRLDADESLWGSLKTARA